MIKNSEVRNLYNIRKLVIIGYIMNLVVLIIPFIVYCVKMYVNKLNMIKYYLFAYGIVFLLQLYQYLFI